MTTILIIVLLIWYKVRKNRMLSETMIKLAEKGVVPPTEAMAALDANRAACSPASFPNTRRSESEFPPSLFAPCNPAADSPAANNPGIVDICVSPSTRMPPIT